MSLPGARLNLSDEAQAVLYLSRAKMAPREREGLQQLLHRDLDWEKMVRLAEAQGVLPLLHHNLSGQFEKKVPDAVLKKLSTRFRANAQTNLVLIAELLNLLELFGKHGIQAVPLRGPVMAVWLYGDLGLRQPGDLDLLVRKQDVIPVKEILVSLGYRPFFPWPTDQRSVFSRGEYAFVRDPGNIMVDLHWKTRGLDFAIPNPPDLWNRLQTIRVEGHSVPILSWQDQLLLMSVHGAKHNWRRLIWLCDVAELVETGTKGAWPQLRNQARSIGASGMVTLALLLANACFQVNLPGEFRAEANDNPSLERLANLFLAALFREEERPTQVLEDPLLFVRCMDRRWDQFRYLFQRTFTPTAWTPGDHPGSSGTSFFRYLMRPLQMARTYALPTMRRHHEKSEK